MDHNLVKLSPFKAPICVCTRYLQAETDDLYKKINEYETAAKEANSVSDKYDADIRDMSKKVQKLEVSTQSM